MIVSRNENESTKERKIDFLKIIKSPYKSKWVQIWMEKSQKFLKLEMSIDSSWMVAQKI